MSSSTQTPASARAPRTRRAARLSASALAFGALTLAAPAALATIVAVAPDFVLLTPPDVRLDQTESDVDIFAFDERQCVKLPRKLETDERVLPAGTRVRCHMVHMDPVDPPQLLQGKARFDTPILGVISSSALLDASDGPCGLPGVVYPAPGVEPFRGLESTQPDDLYEVSPSGYAIRARMNVTAYTDQLRVITSCCPDTGCPAAPGFGD